MVGEKNGMIAIKTINDDSNFGNRLQNYALQKFISDRYGVAKTIPEGFNWKEHYYYGARSLETAPFFRLLFALRYKNRNGFKRELLDFKRKAVFRSFTRRFVPKFKSKKDLDNSDIAIVGSDQIWNPEIRRDLELDFLSEFQGIKKISYAASIGISDFTKIDSEIFRQNLIDFEAVSVREISASQWLNDLFFGEKKAAVVLDPTFLIPRSHWHELALNTQVRENASYILTYFLGNPTEIEQKYVHEFAQKHNCKIIELNNVENEYYTKVGPIEFVWLIENAKFVFADSYHAAVFSIIMHTDFTLFERRSSLGSMNTRMETLFKQFDLKSSLTLEDGAEPEVLNFGLLDDRITRLKRDSVEWLDLAMK